MTSRESFLTLARQAHGDKYDYSLVEYKRYNEAVTLICPHHGEFEQWPILHRQGKGCPACGRERWLAAVTDDSFAEKARAVHGDLYDYSAVNYRNRRTPVTIICRSHGPWQQEPEKHILVGQGCPGCRGGRVSRTKRAQYGVAGFLARAAVVHGGTYDYGEVTYETARKKVTIICRRHGPFRQTPNNHLSLRTGCPRCAVGNTSRAATEWLDGLGVVEREVYLPEVQYRVDGFDSSTLTVYEYFGCFWHGCPNGFATDDVNPKNKVRFGDLYRATCDRVNDLETAGYTVVVKWAGCHEHLEIA